MVGFGPRRRVVPNQNLGQNLVAQRRIAEVAGRAAEKTRVSVSVDAYPCRLFLRNLRGTIPCPCCTSGAGTGDDQSDGLMSVRLDSGEYDDLNAIDSGNPRGTERDDVPGTTLSAEESEDGPTLSEGLRRLLLGNGRRCGICWGSGWVDGYQLWGGNRRVMCVLDAPGVQLLDGTADLDVSPVTPTFVGPGSVTWRVRVNAADRRLDALRVRNGLLPADPGYELSVSADGGTTFVDPPTAMSLTHDADDAVACINTGAYVVRLRLSAGARVSHIELVSRSERLVNLQLPQLQQAASAELIAPFLEEDFELDPVVGFVERGSVMDVQPRDGRLGSLWVVSSVTVKKTSAGQIFGVVGSARSAQPTDVIAAASMTDALRSGLLDRGYATRGLEATGGGAPSGPIVGDTDESAAAARRGSQQRLGGGRDAAYAPTITLSDGSF